MLDFDIEASVVGGLLLGGYTPDAADVLATLDDSAFSARLYRETFKEIKKQAKTRGLIDGLIIGEAMGEGNFGSVMETAKKCPSAANLKGYAGILAEYYRVRQFKTLLCNTLQKIQGSLNHEQALSVMQDFAKDFNGIQQSPDNIEPVHIGELLGPYVDRLEQRQQNGEESDSLKTGIAELDAILGGINPVDLVVVAARPGMGKTEFALKIAESVASQKAIKKIGDNEDAAKKGVLIFSMEMDSMQVVERSLANASQLPVSMLRTPSRLDDEGWARISLGMQRLQDLDVWIVDASSLTVEQIESIAYRCKTLNSNLSLILVDYLGLIARPRAERNDLAVAHISGSLKRMAKKLKTPVMSLSQLSRNVEQRTNKRPTNADLRDSGSIEQDADSVIMLYREAKYNENSPAAKYVEIIVTKNRFGIEGTAYQEFKDGHFIPTDQAMAARVCQEKTSAAPIKRYTSMETV